VKGIGPFISLVVALCVRLKYRLYLDIPFHASAVTWKLHKTLPVFQVLNHNSCSLYNLFPGKSVIIVYNLPAFSKRFSFHRPYFTKHVFSFSIFEVYMRDLQNRLPLKRKTLDSLFLICATSLILCSCAHEAVTVPTGPGGAVAYVTSTGVVFYQAGYDQWRREGVPADYFNPIPHDLFYISNIDWHAGNKIRIKGANPK
jgi:hypothetical protein